MASVNFRSLFKLYGTSFQAIKFSRNFSYQSDLSLNKVYPGSKLKIETPKPPNQQDKFSGYIPSDRLLITYSRSSGPGGQHVNCVNTKVDLRFEVRTADWIPQETRNTILEKYRNKITKDGYFVIKSDTTRSQQMNVADCLEKLRSMIFELENSQKSKPSEDTLEKIQRRHEMAARERLKLKRQRSETKDGRRAPMVEF